MTVVHTFGRDIKFNPHIHLLVSCGGLTPKMKWKNNHYLHHEILKTLWRSTVLASIRKAIKDKIITRFSVGIETVLNRCYEVYHHWYVHIGKILQNAKSAVRYIGRYTKRPAIAATRILSLENGQVSFWYEDHKTKSKTVVSLPVMEFIGKLVTHIHDTHFKQIRYAGLLAPKIKTQSMLIARNLLKPKTSGKFPFLLTWRQRLQILTGKDPLLCPRCHVEMLLSYIHFKRSVTLEL